MWRHNNFGLSFLILISQFLSRTQQASHIRAVLLMEGWKVPSYQGQPPQLGHSSCHHTNHPSPFRDLYMPWKNVECWEYQQGMDLRLSYSPTMTCPIQASLTFLACRKVAPCPHVKFHNCLIVTESAFCIPAWTALPLALLKQVLPK